MSQYKDHSSVFPVPQPKSPKWQTYRSLQYEDNGASVNCPDLITEAEKLFGITNDGSSHYHFSAKYSIYQRGEKGLDTICTYKKLQQLQNRDWSLKVVDGALKEIDLGRFDKALEDLGHAIDIDPNCIKAHVHRIELSIRLSKFAQARLDIKALYRRRYSGYKERAIEYEIQRLNQKLVDATRKEQHQSNDYKEQNRNVVSSRKYDGGFSSRSRSSRSPYQRHGRSHSRYSPIDHKARDVRRASRVRDRGSSIDKNVVGSPKHRSESRERHSRHGHHRHYNRRHSHSRSHRHHHRRHYKDD